MDPQKEIQKNAWPPNQPWKWLYKEPYPDIVAWGESDEVGNIYVAPTASLRLTDMVD